jgi:hypothetical protein
MYDVSVSQQAEQPFRKPLCKFNTFIALLLLPLSPLQYVYCRYMNNMICMESQKFICNTCCADCSVQASEFPDPLKSVQNRDGVLYCFVPCQSASGLLQRREILYEIHECEIYQVDMYASFEKSNVVKANRRVRNLQEPLPCRHAHTISLEFLTLNKLFHLSITDSCMAHKME